MLSVAKGILLAMSRDHSWQGRETICDDGDRNRVSCIQSQHIPHRTISLGMKLKV